MNCVKIYTDGACSGNPGPGGWAAILVYNKQELILMGGESSTTNNRMELTAVLEAIKALKKSCKIECYSDSKYVVDAFNSGWLESWLKNDWQKKDKKPVLNKDLWEELLQQLSKHQFSFNWVSGHSGHEMNERCDKYAVKMAATHSFITD